MCQVPEFSLYTDVPVVYCARIVLAVNNLNEIPCCLKKQPGEEEEEAALAWWGGECDTRATQYQIEIKPDTTQTHSQPWGPALCLIEIC